MSQYDEICSSELTCPYCACVVIDDWELQEYGIMECSNCDKKYHFSREIVVKSFSSPDCELNETSHELEFYNNEVSFCKICDKCVSNKE